jgi:ArsR family transcriptional regulator
LDRSTADRLAQTFKALSDPTRVQIVSLLAGTELCVYDLAATLGMSQSAVSHQLRTLRDWRLVRRRREGRQIFYALDDEHVIDLFRRGLDHVTHE